MLNLAAAATLVYGTLAYVIVAVAALRYGTAFDLLFSAVGPTAAYATMLWQLETRSRLGTAVAWAVSILAPVILAINLLIGT